MTYHYPASAFRSDSSLRKIELHGPLREEFGSSFELSVSSPREALRALVICVPGFQDALRLGEYRVVLGTDADHGLGIDETNIDISISERRTLHVVPVIEGSKKGGVGKVLAGIALVALAVAMPHMGAAIAGIGAASVAGVSVSGAILMVGTGLAVGGLAQMLAPSPVLGDYSDREDENVSYLMNGVVNTVEEGGAVPVLLGGPVMCGSHVISSGIEITELDFDGNTSNDFRGGGGRVDGEGGDGDYNNQYDIIGYKSKSKGGGSAQAARETPNSIGSEAVARVLDLLSAGEIEGYDDEEFPFRNLYLDDTVVENSDGSRNFSGIGMDLRVGLPGQDYIAGFSQSETPTTVGVKILRELPLTRSVTSDPATGLVINRVKVLLRFPALTEQDTKTGDVNGSSVSYRIGIIPNGGSVDWVVDTTLSEKFTSQFQKIHSIELPETGHPYQIRVERITPNSPTVAIQNEIFWDALFEVIDGKLSYPGCALSGLTAYARQFGDRIPSRGWMMKGVICEVPSNYDPIKRTYSGNWNGTFVRLWTNNPAWILWTALTNEEWGIGKRIPRNLVDKWTMYEVAQYCDKYTSDGLEKSASFTTAASDSAVRKTPVRVVIRSDTSVFTPGAVIDGVTMVAGDRVLLTEQNSPQANGIWVWNSPTSLSRATDSESALQRQYELVAVTAGTFRGRNYLQVNTEASQSTLGGTYVSVEPRYAFNMWINSREQVYKAMQTIASSFRGLLIWGRGMVMATQDAPRSPRRLITNANVKQGRFVYEGTGRKAIHTVALVTWVNPADGWKANVEVVENPALIAKYGWRPADVFAAGCTSRAQARRTGLWSLYTEQYESELVTFKGSFEVADVIPGDVVQIADSHQIGIRMGGRLKVGPTVGADSQVTLDKPFAFQAGQTYRLYLTGADGIIHERVVTNTPGTTDIATFDGAFTDFGTSPQGGGDSVYIITSSQIARRLFRIFGVSELEDNDIEIIASEHHPEKFALIEQGTPFDPQATSVYDSRELPGPPSAIDLSRLTVTTPTGVQHDVQVSFITSSSMLVNEYTVRWRHQSGSWTTITTMSNNARFPYLGSGKYEVIVQGRDIRGRDTVPVFYSEDFAEQRSVPVSNVTGLRIKGQSAGVSSFSAKVLRLEWDLTVPVGYQSDDWLDPYFRDYEVKLLDSTNAPIQTFYVTDQYFEISADKYGEYLGALSRQIYVSVRLRDTYDTPTTPQIRVFSNPAPTASVTVEANLGQVSLKYSDPVDIDYTGILVWAGTSPGFTMGTSTLVWEGPGRPRFNWPVGTTCYLRWAFYDEFGRSGLTVSAEESIMVTGVTTVDLDTTPPSVPTGLTLTSSSTLDPVTGQTFTSVVATWTASPEADVMMYLVEMTEFDGTPSTSFVNNPRADWEVKSSVQYSVRVLAMDRTGNKSAYTALSSIVSARDNTAPNVPFAFTANGYFSSVGLKWTNPTAVDLVAIEIWENSTNNSGTATLIDTVSVISGVAGVYVRDGLPNGATRFYWLKSRDTSGNISGFSTMASATVQGIGTIDLAPGVTAIENGDYGARSVTAPFLPPNLPATGNVNGRQVFNLNSSDLRLYTYRNGAWVSTVSAENLTGTILANQIRDLAATQITGFVEANQIRELLSTQITGNITSDQIESVLADKISGELALENIPGIDSSKIIDGSIGPNELADLAITAGKFATGLTPMLTWNLGSLPASGSYPIGQLLYWSTDTKVYRNTSTGWSKTVDTADFANQVQDNQIAGLTASKLSGLIEDARIPELSASKISSGTFAAARIADGSLLVTKFADTVRPVEVLSALPSTGNVEGRQVYLTTDGRVYRWKSGEWTSSITASQISDQLLAAQIPNLDAGKITTGALLADRIANGAITAAKFAENLTPIKTVAALPDANSEQVGQLVFLTADSKVYRNVQYSGYRGWAKHVDGGDISANSITGNSIQAGTISAGLIGAGAILTRHLSIGNFDNVVPDGDYRDMSFWDGGTDQTYPQTNLSGDAWTYPRGVVYYAGNRDVYSKLFPVEVGATYRITYRVWNGDMTSGYVGMFMHVPSVQFQSLKLSGEAGVAITGDTNPGSTSFWTSAQDTQDVSYTWTNPTGALANANRSVQFRLIGNYTGEVVFQVRMVRVSDSTLIKDGAITTGKIFADSITGEKIKADAIGAREIAANSITAAEIKALTITAAEIAGGTITGDKVVAGTISTGLLAANAVTASKIAVSDVTNLMPDPAMIEEAAWEKGLGAGGSATLFPVSGLASRNFWSLVANAGAFSVVYSKWFKVVPGDNLRFQIQGRVVNGTGGSIGADLQFADQDYGSILQSARIDIASTSVVDAALPDVIVPAGRQFARVRLYKTDAGTTTNVHVGGVVVRHRMRGELIVDGSITADKIYAGSVIAGKLGVDAVTAGTIASDVIGAREIVGLSITATEIAAEAIVAAKIKGGEITGIHIASNSVGADKITAGTIVAGNLAAGAITVSKLLVAPTNLVPDPQFNDFSWWAPEAGGWFRQVPSSVTDYSYSMGVTSAAILAGDRGPTGSPGTARKVIYSQIMKGVLAPGSTYMLRAKVKNGSNQNIYMDLSYFDGVGTYITGVGIAPAVPGFNSATEMVFTPPATAASYQIAIYNLGGPTFTGAAAVSDVRIIEAASINMIVNGSIVSDKIATGAIVAEKISAGAITAGKISISDFSNLIPDGSLSSGTMDGWFVRSGGAASDSISVGGPEYTSWPSPYGIRLIRQGGGAAPMEIIADRHGFDTNNNAGIPVKPGDEFHLEFMMYQNIASNLGIDFVIRRPDSTVDVLPVTEALENCTIQSGTIVPNGPIDAYKRVRTTVKNTSLLGGKAYVRFSYRGGNDGTVFIWQTLVRRRGTGELIVDGSIFAKHLTANSVKAVSIEAGAVSVDKIQAGSIDASRLVIGMRGATLEGSIFTTVKATNTVSWGPGVLRRPKGIDGIDSYNIAAGSFVSTGGTYYIVHGSSNTTLDYTTDPLVLNNPAFTLIAIYRGGSNLVNYAAGSIIDGDRIITGSITATQIMGQTITADQISANTIDASRLVIGMRGASLEGSIFTTNKATNTVSWTGGVFRRSNGTAGLDSIEIVAGGFASPGGNWYIVHGNSDTTLGGTTDPFILNNPLYTLIAIYRGGSDLVNYAAGSIIDGDRIITGSITATQIKGQTITGTLIDARTITGDNMVIGTIRAAEIATGAITATKLLVQGNNLNPDPFFKEVEYANANPTQPRYWYVPPGWSFQTRASPYPDALGVPSALIMNTSIPAGEARYIYQENWQTGISQGQKFRIRARGRNDSNQDMGISLQFRNSATLAATGFFGAVNFPPEFTARTYEGQVSVPDGYDQYRIVTYNTGNVAGSNPGVPVAFVGTLCISGIEMVEASTGKMIVDGAITTNHITVGTLKGDRIEVGTLDATRIVAGSITANLLRVQGPGMNADPQMKDLTYWTPSKWFVEEPNSSVAMPNRHWTLWSARPGQVAIGTARTEVKTRVSTGAVPNAWYKVSARVRNASNQTAAVQLTFLDSNGVGVLGIAAYSAPNSGNGAVIESGKFQAPANAVSYEFTAYNEGIVSTFSGVISVSDIQAVQLYTGGLIVDGTIEATNIMARTIDATNIKVGTLTGTELSADTIQAKHLTIGNFDNIIPDGNYRDISFWTGGATTTGIFFSARDSFWRDSRSLDFVVSGAYDVYTKLFPVEPGATYKVSYRQWTNGTGFSGYHGAFIHVPSAFWNSMLLSGNTYVAPAPNVPEVMGTMVSGNPDIINSANGFVTTKQDSFDRHYLLTIPNSPVQRQIQFRFKGNHTDAAVFQVKMVRVSDTTLIAENSISTGKIQAEAITAAKIKVTNLSAINSDLGAITAGSLNINNLFIVNPNGGVLMRSAVGGQRTEIDSYGGRTYDSNGTMRVRWGIW